jgi:hypothetical protein
MASDVEVVQQNFQAAIGKSAKAVRPKDWLAERLLVVMLLALAAVCSSFVARNSDVWMHRAVGRLLAQGQYQFGVDPFGQDTAGRYWTNHAWLYDLGLYVLWELVGDAGVVAAKVALVVLLAYLLWRIGCFWSEAWVAGLVGLLAIEAISPRLLLQPMILSLLGLAAVLWCYQRGGRWRWGIPLLTAVWVNVDSWFILGLLIAVLLVAVPELPGSRRPWGILLATGVASLCSPHMWHVWTWPMELSPAVWRSAWVSDPRLASLFASPWSRSVLISNGLPQLAGWALLLMLAGWWAAVAATVYRRQIDVVLLLGVILFVLGSWQLRLTPLWVIAAVPLLSREAGRWLQRGEVGTVPLWGTVTLAAVLLGLACWGGLQHGVAYRERTLAWGVYEHPGLRRLAEHLRQWQVHQANKVPLFTTHPDVAHYLAWFAPEVRSSYDLRLSLFVDSADRSRRWLQQLGLVPNERGLAQGEQSEEVSSRPLVAVLYDPDWRRWSAALAHVYRSASIWRPLSLVAGELLLESGNGTAADWQRLLQSAWHDEQLRPTGDGPSALALPAPWWRISWPRRRLETWQTSAARTYLRLQELASDSSPQPQAALLALRAARCALEQEASDATAWLLVARATQMLYQHPWEADPVLAPLQQMRLAQFRGALLQAVRAQPHFLLAHQFLALSWAQWPAWDLAFEHAQLAGQLMQQAGPVPGEPPTEYQQRLEQWHQWTNQLERQLRDNENRLWIRNVGRAGQPLLRAREAIQLGLYKAAIDILQDASPALYGSEGLVMLLELLVQTGRMAEAIVLLDQQQLRQQPLRLGLYTVPLNGTSSSRTFELPAYYWFQLVTAAATGQYHQAQQAATAIRDFLQQQREQLQPQLLPLALAQSAVGEIGLAAPGAGGVVCRWLGVWKRQRLRQLCDNAHTLQQAMADFDLLSGLLALEAGDATTAEQAFKRAANAYHDNIDHQAATQVAPGHQLWQRYRALLP